jgi:hypothetical protein
VFRTEWLCLKAAPRQRADLFDHMGLQFAYGDDAAFVSIGGASLAMICRRSAVLVLAAWPMLGQAAETLGAGVIDCVIDVSGAGYRDHQEHHWDVAGSGPLTVNVIQVLAGTWTVHGQGELSRSQGSQTLTAHWTTNGAATAPMAVLLRAVDGMLILKSWHTQLRIRNGIQGQQQQFIGGQPQRPVPLGLEAFEWAVPLIQGAANSTALSGKITFAAPGPTGPMQPADARGAVTCSWNFTIAN